MSAIDLLSALIKTLQLQYILTQQTSISHLTEVSVMTMYEIGATQRVLISFCACSLIRVHALDLHV